MRHLILTFLAAAGIFGGATATAQLPSDSVFIYSPGERSGLHAAVLDNGAWHHVGQLCSSDYGPWGAEKRMYHPSLCRAKDGTWRLVFQVNDHSPLFAAAYSRDLTTWRPQDYPRVSAKQCLKPVVSIMEDGFNIFFHSEQGVRRVYASSDFRTFSKDMSMPLNNENMWQRDVATVDGKLMEGQKFAVSREEKEHLRQYFAARADDARLSSERMHDDATVLSGSPAEKSTPPVLSGLPAELSATLTIDMTRQKPISDKLIGIFFEDISYAADGGLYAELIQNRDFEYSSRDRREWNATTAWHSSKPIAIATDNALHANNPHYAVITNDTLWNEGWDGIAVESSKDYDFSIFVKGKKQIAVQLTSNDGRVIASAVIKAKGKEWKRYECTLKATATEPKARFMLLPKGTDTAAIDMVSLFPKETFMNRKNGLRRDLAQTIADLHPKFVRFPGGCMSHGQGLENIYHWHHTIGELHERKPDFNIWHYHQTRGLGFYEYFLFCEDIGAEPLPVLAAGVPCQNSGANAQGIAGQQGGIPMEDMPAYIDELCHLIEWANGDPARSEWAKMRADAGHPAPFNLKYLGIGNEDIIGTVFEQRYAMICQALRQRHPEIKLCGTVGPFHAPSADYIEGWDFTRKHPGLQYMTDEHYYESTGWFLHHRDYYDSYPRQNADGTPATKVYLGEWAASTREKRPNMETALAEALYLTDIERNADIVEMTSYAPMLCKDGHSNWNPDMIYFSNTEVRTTPAYEVQRLFSLGAGDRYVTSLLKVNGDSITDVTHRLGASLVIDSKTGKKFLKLVNATPSRVDFAVSGLTIPSGAACTEMKGTPTDRKAKAQPLSTDRPTLLPPYSIRMIEF